MERRFKNNRLFLITLVLIIEMAIFTLTVFLNDVWKIGLSYNDIERTVGAFILISLLVLCLSPGLLPVIKKELVRSESVKVILVPIFLTLVVDYIIELSRYLPILFDGEFVRVAKGQVVSQLAEFSISSFIFMALFPAILEEFIYRFLPYGGVKALLEKVITEDLQLHGMKKTSFSHRIIILIYDSIFIKKNKVALGVIIILTSILFSLLHVPDATNFYVYFISGVLFSFYYLKYGFLSCIIGHTMSNYLPFSYYLAKVTAEILFGIKLS